MPQVYDNELRGVLFKDRPKTEKSPLYTGNITIGGVEYRLAAWLRESKKGTKFLSIKASAPDNDEMGSGQYAPRQPQQQQAWEDDDVPF